LREKDFHAKKQINSVAKQCCFATKQSISVTDRSVFATKKIVCVTQITSAVKALTASAAKKSINDALPVISETELIFIAGKQTLLNPSPLRSLPRPQRFPRLAKSARSARLIANLIR